MRVGRIALVGRPNVGKSTLLNQLVGQKLSITSRRAQTTRVQVQGILTLPEVQMIFVDTPGFQQQHEGMLYRSMNRSVTDALGTVDQVVMVVEALRWTPADQAILLQIPAGIRPLLVINKVDRAVSSERMIHYLQERQEETRFSAIFPVSALQRSSLDPLVRYLGQHLPEGPLQYEPDQVSDRTERFFVGEFIREQIFRQLGDELPYATAVMIDRYVQEKRLIRIEATLLVDNPGQKAILIGQQGSRLKAIGTAARLQIEKFLESKVYLGLWVKVKSGWAEDGTLLKQLGHDF
ncbi:GTPase Era [Ferrovum sp.]|uniref:GTPase Era n=1 Tax=Ferrovum sp. TaxID=2609467 RepID=UPI00260F0DE0|nr:GTPase Era [Ferrovum sp.]